MAKLVKVTGYIILHDDVNDAEIKTVASEILSSKFDGISHGFQTDSVSLGKDLFYNEDWNNHPLNKINCTAETCESYFEEGH